MERNKINNRNAIITILNPLQLNGKAVYRLVVNKENSLECIQPYLCYLLAAQDFLRNGGSVKDNKNTWVYDQFDIKVNGGFRKLLTSLYAQKVRYTIDYFVEPIVYTEEQVDENCFILDHNLLKTYTDLYKTERTNDDEEIGK